MTTESLKITSDSGPFAIIPEWVLKSSMTHGAVRLYGLLARYADWETGEAWPSRRTLADALSVSTDTIDRWIRELEQEGALRVCRRVDEQAENQQINLTNLYTIVRNKPRGGGKNAEGGGMDAPRGGRNSAGTGGGRDAAVSITNLEQDLIEQESLIKVSDIKVVFYAWCEHANKDPKRTKMDSKRVRAIKWALKNYPLEEVLLAVEGWKHLPFYRGENKDRRVYNDLTLLLRDSQRVEMFRDAARNPGASLSAPQTWSRLLKYLEDE